MAKLETQYLNYLKDNPASTRSFADWKRWAFSKLDLQKMGEVIKETIYIDMDDTICNFTKAYNEAIARFPEQKYPQAQLDFFRKLEPMPDAISSIKRLDENYEVLFATRPSHNNPLCYTEKALWIKDHFGPDWVQKLYFAPDKSKLIGEYLIDDKPWVGFQGKQILFGSEDFPNWNKIIFKINWEKETI
jgi:5'(3')-deoxyribonucleotidase